MSRKKKLLIAAIGLKLLKLGVVAFLFAVGVAEASTGLDPNTPSNTLSARADDYKVEINGQPMQWREAIPDYVAYAFDQSANGQLVFAGVPRTVGGILESADCQAVGCHVYLRGRDGKVKQLFSESAGFGIIDLSISSDGKRIVAAGTNPGGPGSQGHIWTWNNGEITKRVLKGQGYATEVEAGKFYVTSNKGEILTGKGDGSWQVKEPGPRCAFYDFSLAGQPLISGWSGTYALAARGKAAKVGPPSDAVWSSESGRTVVVSPIARSSELKMSRDGGKHWQSQALIDNVGDGPCSNSSQNNPGDCSDKSEGARLDFRAVEGSGTDNLYAFGVRQDLPGGRVYRYVGNNRWERVPFPAAIAAASSATVGKDQLTVATMDGMLELVPTVS